MQLEDRKILMLCLGKMEEVRQEVFKSYYWSDLKIREIAVIMDLSDASVKAHLRRGRKGLLNCLWENGMQRGLSEPMQKKLQTWTALEEGLEAFGGKE